MIMHAFAVSNEILIIHLSFKVRQLENILREQKCMKTRMHLQKNFTPLQNSHETAIFSLFFHEFSSFPFLFSDDKSDVPFLLTYLPCPIVSDFA